MKYASLVWKKSASALGSTCKRFPLPPDIRTLHQVHLLQFQVAATVVRVAL